MNIDDVMQLAAEARAAELIEGIESGELNYDTVMAELRGGVT